MDMDMYGYGYGIHIMDIDSNLWSTAVPSRPSTMRELARPCLNDDDFKYT